MSRDTDMLREEIEQTRERMSETLDQLGERLNPNRIKQQVKDNVREATIGRVEEMARHASDRVHETREGIIDTIRDNPVPAAMIGIGLGWLLFGGRRDSRSHSHSVQADDLGSGYIGNVSSTTPRLQQDDAAGGMGASISHDGRSSGLRAHVGDVASSAREHVSDVTHRAGERISSAKDTATERLSSVKDTATERAGEVKERVQHVASDLAQTTRYQAHRAEERVSTTMQDNPLAVGAVAIALGMAAGFAIPETRRENEILGPARDKLMDRARMVASEAKERAHEVVDRVKEAAEEELSASSTDSSTGSTTGYSATGTGSSSSNGSTLL